MKNDLIGGSVLPISNMILKEKIVLDGKPEYEQYTNGFYIATRNINSFTDEFLTKEAKKEYDLLEEIKEAQIECEKQNLPPIDERKYKESKSYRKEIKESIFNTKIQQLLNL